MYIHLQSLFTMCVHIETYRSMCVGMDALIGFKKTKREACKCTLSVTGRCAVDVEGMTNWREIELPKKVEYWLLAWAIILLLSYARPFSQKYIGCMIPWSRTFSCGLWPPFSSLFFFGVCACVCIILCCCCVYFYNIYFRITILCHTYVPIHQRSLFLSLFFQMCICFNFENSKIIKTDNGVPIAYSIKHGMLHLKIQTKRKNG